MKRGIKPKLEARLYVVRLKSGRWKASVRFAFDERLSIGTHGTREECGAAFARYMATGERCKTKRGPKRGTTQKVRRRTRVEMRVVTPAPAVASTDRIALLKMAWARTA